jgi:hypothetical protein
MIQWRPLHIADESYMIVSAKETKTYESELYISFRKPDLTWAVPLSLGPKINDGLPHRWGAIRHTGRQIPLLFAWHEREELHGRCRHHQ